MHAGAARIAALQACLRHAKASTYPEVFALRAGARYQIVRVQEIRWMEAAGMDQHYNRLPATVTPNGDPACPRPQMSLARFI